MPRQRMNAATKRPAVTLGLGAAAKINAVEGVVLSEESRRMFARFERESLTPEQRRQAIVEKHAKKA
jgi:hypothetical protein